jgi:valyl-tRNA synthetase
MWQRNWNISKLAVVYQIFRSKRRIDKDKQKNKMVSRTYAKALWELGKGIEKSLHQTLLPLPQKRFLNQKIKKQFDEVIEIISYVRKYRGDKKIPFKKQIKELVIHERNKKIEKYFTLLKLLLNIKSIKIRKTNQMVRNPSRISIFW